MKAGDYVEYKTVQHPRRLRGGILKGFSWAVEDGWLNVYNPASKHNASVLVTNLVFFRVLPAKVRRDHQARTVECPGCGEIFTTNVPHRVWCSRSCRTAKWRREKNAA